eukprot:g7698.t1
MEEDAQGGSSKHVAPDIIVGVAKMLGIDAVNEPEYLWIAEQCAKAELPSKDWRELTNENGETMYYHVRTKRLQKLHPLLEQYAGLYHKQASFVKMSGTSQQADLDSNSTRLSGIITEILNRVTSHLPPMTPEMVDKVALLLECDTKTEYFLARVIKQTIEAYVEKQFNLGTILQDLEKPLDFLRKMRKQQVKVDVIRKPDTVVMCQECEEKSAVVKCQQCKDFFCQDCFNATHATGKRRGHIIQDVEQLVCAACDHLIATCQCIQCGLFYCDQCFVSTHASRPELHNHLKRIINGLVCLECEHYNASVFIGMGPNFAVLCEDCVDLFCTECFIKLHRKGKRRQHVHLTIDNTGQVFRGGFLVPPEEAQVLTDRARSTAESGPWVAFKDDNLNTYWYNFTTKTRVMNNPYDKDPDVAIAGIEDA